jgi:hypothetical protein
VETAEEEKSGLAARCQVYSVSHVEIGFRRGMRVGDTLGVPGGAPRALAMLEECIATRP